jgi:hypothetical protein
MTACNDGDLKRWQHAMMVIWRDEIKLNSSIETCNIIMS